MTIQPGDCFYDPITFVLTGEVLDVFDPKEFPWIDAEIRQEWDREEPGWEDEDVAMLRYQGEDGEVIVGYSPVEKIRRILASVAEAQ